VKKLKAAIFGTGFMGRVHTEALRRLGNIEVTGVAARTPEAARKFADAMGIPRATADYKELLADPELDAVHICTPNELHFPMAKAAMEAGKNVLCEKPLASSVEEAKTMIKMAAEKKLANCTFYNVRAYPQVQNMRRMREAGDLGDILVVQGTYSTPTGTGASSPDRRGPSPISEPTGATWPNTSPGSALPRCARISPRS
jgi:predicted dehydrogenase